jgi:hypothetical protein
VVPTDPSLSDSIGIVVEPALSFLIGGLEVML